MTALPIIIAPGDPGHIGHHQTIHALLNPVDAPFALGGTVVDVFANLPAAGVAGRYYYDEDLERLFVDDGTTWRNVASQYYAVVTDPLYGALGNGINNDAAEIQAALDSGAAVVVFPEGVYLTGSTSLEVNADDITLVGAGKYATQIKYTGSGAALMMNGSSATLNERLAVRDMTIDCRGASAGWTGLQIDNVRVADYERVWINGIGAAAGVGIDIIGGDPAAKSCYFNSFREVDVSCDGATGICIRIGDNCNGHKFYGGIIEGTAKALVMKPTTFASGTNYFDQVAWQTSNATMFDIGGGGANAADNYFLNCRMEPGTAVTVTLGTKAFRNFFLNSLDSNVTVSDSAANETTIINHSPPIFQWGRAQPVGTPYDTAKFTGTNSGRSGIIVGATRWAQGTGTPEGVVTAPIGSLFSRTDGGAGTSLYIKQSGSGNTGWAAVTP